MKQIERTLTRSRQSARVAFAELHKGVLPDALVELIITETYSVASLRACIVGCSRDHGAHVLVARRRETLIGRKSTTA